MNETFPATDQQQRNPAPHLVIEPFWKDDETGATYVHTDLRETQAPYDAEKHIGPVKTTEILGDVESWIGYVTKYAAQDSGDGEAKQETFLTWSSKGLRAVLDYHTTTPGRCQWVAEHRFELTPEFRDWMNLASGHAVPQQKAVEFLEDHAFDIFEPEAGELTALLRALRGNSTAQAETTLREDGTADVRFQRSTTVSAGNSVTLPSTVTVQIPVLKGHTEDDGSGGLHPVRYKLVLRLRASVGSDARLELRFSMPAAERVLEEVYAERVTVAKELLGEDYVIYRAAG